MINSKARRDEGQTGKGKKADLNKQFEQFKMKIQEFEDKNDQIITRIREACSFKKRQVEQQLPHSRVVYYDRGDEADSLNSSNDYSKQIVYDGNLVSHHPPHPQHPIHQHQYYHKQVIPIQPSSQEYIDKKIRNSQEQPLRSSQNKSSRGLKATKAYSSQGIPPDYPQLRQSEYHQDSKGRERRQTGRFLDSSSELENRLKELAERNKELQEVVGEREEEVRGVQAKMKGFATSFKRMVADQFENYHQDVVIQRMLQLEKCFKRYDNRLKNLNLKVKDAIQDRKAHRVISKSKRRRSNSRYKQSSTSSVQMKESSTSGPRDIPRSGTSPRPSLRNQGVKQKQFAEIANGYQKMVKTKVQELEKIQEKLREEIISKEKLTGELTKARLEIQEKDSTINDLRRNMKVERGQNINQGQLKSLQSKIQALQEQVRNREQKEKELNASLQKMQKTKRAALDEQKQNFNKIISKKSSSLNQLEQKLKESQSIYLKEISQMKEKLIEADKRLMEKDCQILGLASKMKKVEGDCLLKEQKLKELESLIIRDAEPDILDRSISVDNSLVSASQVRMLQDAIRRHQEQVDQKTILAESLQRQIFQLQTRLAESKAQKEDLFNKVDELEGKLRQKEAEAGEGMMQRQSEATRQLQDRVLELEEVQTERADLVEQRELLVEKGNLLLEEVKKFQQENLSLSRQLIKLKSQVSFSQAEFIDLQKRHNRLKDQAHQAKMKMGQNVAKKEEQQKILRQKIRQLQTQVQICRNSHMQLQIGRREEGREEQNLLNSINISEMSFNLPNNHQKALEEELVLAKQKLREIEAIVEAKDDMERQVQQQYRANLDMIRADLAQKNKQLENKHSESEQLRKQMRSLQQQQREDVSFQNYKIALYEEKIVQLQAQFNSSKESQQKLNQLLHELTQNLRGKAEEREQFLKQIQLKDKTIEQLRDVLELKESKQGNRQSIKSSKDRQSLNRDFSLRMSADQSEEISDLAEVSYLSNISDVFKRDDLLQQKMKRGKTSREEFVRLFTKTSAYIKSLKEIIDGKDRRIKQLERQLSGMKKDDLPQQNWSGVKQRKIELNMLKTCPLDESQNSVEEFKDQYSVQIDTKRSKSYELIKELQNEKALAVQENKMLIHQIELLQDQITRAEEQENNLVRIKDLYKDEIKKLMEKNEEHTQEFQLQINKLKGQLNESESYHNWEAVKQLFVKVIRCVAAMDDQASKVKRDEKRKELEQFTKVLSSILGLQVALRDKLLAALRK